MSNLLKYNSFVIQNQDKLVIDSNKMADEIIEQYKQLHAKAESGPVPDADGFVCGLEAATVEQLVMDEEAVQEQDAQTEFKPIDMAELHKQGEEIINQARTEAELIKSRAQSAGYEQGLAEGRTAADKQLETRMRQLEQEYSERLKALEAEYAKMRSDLEPELVNTLLDVFAKVTNTLADGKRDTVLFLINGVLRNTEVSKEYIIRVSEDDYNYLISNKHLIHNGITKDIKIDICIDGQLSRNQCIIETDSGVFDCSLDIQLENLINDIRLLSCLGD